MAAMFSTETGTHIIATLVLLGQVSVVAFIVGLPWRKKELRPLYDFAASAAIPGAFLVVACGFLGSLYFSEIAKYPPCELCWFQRIVFYPQLVLLGLAMAKKNRDVYWQVMTLSIIGLVISVYQSYLQYGGGAILPCSTAGFAVTCGQKNFLEYGYITIPVMAMTGFALLVVAMVLHRWTTAKGVSTSEQAGE